MSLCLIDYLVLVIAQGVFVLEQRHFWTAPLLPLDSDETGSLESFLEDPTDLLLVIDDEDESLNHALPSWRRRLTRRMA